MCVVIDLDVVCLTCLQPSKEMHSVFTPDVDSSELQIAQKISILSELKIDQNNQTLPSKICDKCLQDLRAAWRFRKNCQAAVTIFQTIVRLDIENPEDTASKELEQQIKIPQGLQIKRIDQTSDPMKEPRTSSETFARRKASLEEYVIISDKDGSTLYKELAPTDYEENQDETREFLSLEDAGETNENDNEDEDENTLVEYYLTEEALTEEPTIKIDNQPTAKSTNAVEDKQSRRKQLIECEAKSSKHTEFLAKINKPLRRGRPRNSTLLQKVESEKTTVNIVKRTKVLSKIKSEETNSSEDSMKHSQPQVRQVKTRKRKCLSPDTKPPKICEICGNSYRFQHALNAHMRRHYNDKPFSCEFCDKAFVSNVELQRHMRVHTGQKPYACQYCDRRFSDFGSRIKHERTHTGERPYHCGSCGKSFAYPHVLSVHLRTHTREKRFPCDYCSKGFTKKAYLLNHVEQHHNGPNNFQVIIDDGTDNSQMETIKDDETFEKCIFTTEYINEELEEDTAEYDDEENKESGKIIIIQSLRAKIEESDEGQDDEGEDNDVGIHGPPEIHPDEYKIKVR